MVERVRKGPVKEGRIMKKRAVMAALLMLLMTLAGVAAAEEDRAARVQAQFFPDGVPEDVTDTLYIPDAQGSEWYLIAYQGGWMHGYCHTEGEEKWRCTWSGFFWPDAEDLRLVQTGDAAFEAVSRSLDARMRYISRGQGFALTGWRDRNAWPGDAEILENAVIFDPDGQDAPVEIAIGCALKDWLRAFEDLPKTPEDMQARAALCREPVAARMPGWTLGHYEMYNGGSMADAGFYRIENGELTVCRMILDSEDGVTYRAETPSVPLSDALLRRLETEDAEGLIDVSGSGATFCTEDAWDTNAIPIRGEIRQNELQSHALIAITERDGARYAAIAEKDGQGQWNVRESRPLPDGAGMDTYHNGDDSLILEWMDENQETMCFFDRLDSGAWRLTGVWYENWTQGAGEHYDSAWYGLRMEEENWEEGSADTVCAYGAFAFSDLFQVDFGQLPIRARDAAASVDSSGWAAVMNPDPGDRLHLRDQPDRDAVSRGKFYNGTPLQIVEEKGDWCQVRIGTDHSVWGWMMKRYLVFGDDLRHVRQAFPDLFLREEAMGRQPLLMDGRTDADYHLNGREQIIGVREDTDQWIVMTEAGDIFLAPQAWFWEGNG